VKFKAQKNLLDFARELFDGKFTVDNAGLSEEDLFSILLEVMRFLNIATISFSKDGTVNYELAKDHAPVILGNIGKNGEESFRNVIERVDLVIQKKIELYDFETFMAETYVDEGRIEEASDTIKILNKNLVKPDRPTSGRIYRVMGTVDFFLGNIDLAKAEFERSMELCDEENDNECVGSALLGIGNILSVQADNNSAAQYYDRAFSSFMEVGNKKGMAKSKINLSYAFARMGNIWDSNVANVESLNLLLKIRDKNLLQSSYLNRSSMLIAHGEYREASESIMNAYYVCMETGNKRIFHLTRLAMTDIEISRQRNPVKSYIIKALHYFKKISSLIDIAHCYATLAEYHISDRRTKDAVHYIKKSVLYSLKIHDLASIVSAGIKILRVSVIYKIDKEVILDIHGFLLENITDKRFSKMYYDIVKQFLPFI